MQHNRTAAVSIKVEVGHDGQPPAHKSQWTLEKFIGLALLVAITLVTATTCYLAIQCGSVEPLIRMSEFFFAILGAAAKLVA